MEKNEKKEEELKYFVRVNNVDLDGTKAVQIALTRIDGIGRRTARVITTCAKVNPRAQMGRLSEEEVDRIRKVVGSYTNIAPAWMMNRPADVYTGESKHLFGTDVVTAREDDVNRMRKIRCYRGIRHELGQKVRGQRTRSTGRTGATVGVIRKKE
ncbi:MAG: 30S ribosomal protein S13 [Methanomicrobiales archaeon]|nr:30S ribosomal protein S13 [Methanomicrobiales archaeon]